MKNFLSKLWSLSRADRVRTLAIDAVSLPSLCRVNMLKLVSVLVLILTLGVGNAWAVVPKTSDLNFGSAAVSATFESESVKSVTNNTGSAATNSSLTGYGPFTVSYLGKNTNGIPSIAIVDGSSDGDDPMTSKYFAITSTNNGASVSSGYTNATGKGAFSFKITKTSKLTIGLYNGAASGSFGHANAAAYLQFDGGSNIKISAGRTSSSPQKWDQIVSSSLPSTDILEIAVVYNTTNSSTTYGGSISLAANSAHVYINGTAADDGEGNAKNFYIGGNTIANFRLFDNTTGRKTSCVDDIMIYSALPTAAASGWKLKGSFDSWGDGYAMTGSGTVSVTRSLAANTRYEFKIYDGSTAYGNNGAIVHSISDWTFATDKNNCVLYTGPAGDYTFSINTSTKFTSVTYPSVTHPNANYVYIKKGAGWSDARIYNYQSGSDSKMSDWGGSPILASCEICDETYYYGAAYFNKIIFRDGGSNQSNEVSLDRGKWLDETTHADSWSTFDKYTISYDKGTGTGGSMSSHTDLCPGSNQALSANAFTKDHYHFTGWVANVNVTINSATVTAGTLITGTPTIQNVQSDITLTAQWEVNSNTLTWNWGGGSTTSTSYTLYPATSGSVNYGTTITYPANGTMSKTGYNFSSWSSSATSMPDEALTITANWTAKTTSITLNKNNEDASGSTAGSASWTYDQTTKNSLTAATRTGYNVDGYYTAASSGTKILNADGSLAGNSITVDAVVYTSGGKWAYEGTSLTLFAHWTAKDYTVTFSNGSGTGGESSRTVTYKENTNLTTDVTVPTYAGNDFRGYYTSTGGSGTKVIDGNGAWIRGTSYVDASGNWVYDGSPTLHAYYTTYAYENYRTTCSDMYDIVLDDGLAATTNNGSAKVAANGKTLTSIEAPTKNGYDIEGYYTTSGLATKIATPTGALSASITVSGDAWTDGDSKWVFGTGATFYTKWTAHEYTITYEGLEGASNTNPTSYTVVTPTITLANPGSRTGYTFTGWTCGGDPITSITIGSTGDKTITATWSINTPNLAVSAADHVVITATPASELAIAEGANRNVNYNKTVTLNCTPDEHWNLVWDVYKTGESSTKVALSGSGDGATFTMPDYGVTVSAVMTEATYHTATFKNNGAVIDGYDEVKTYDGERPSAPTLTDITDACDKTDCNKFYGWIAEANIWPQTIPSVAGKTIYRNAGDIPVVSGADVVYHAVWAKGTGSPDIPNTLIAKWDKQSITASTAIKATDKDGNTLNSVTMTSNISMTTSAVYGYANTSISSDPVITLAGLDFSDYNAGVITFFARGSQKALVTVEYSTDGGSSYSTNHFSDGTEKKELGYVVTVPNTTTNVQISYGSNEGNFYFGNVRAYGETTTSYDFTELTSSNTSGWSGADWDGYYLIVGNSKTKALRSDIMEGLYGMTTVSPSEGVISTSDLGLMFKVKYNSSTSKYAIRSAATQDYLTDNAGGFSEVYHLLETSATEANAIAYNDITHTTGYYVRWNSDRFGSYGSCTQPTLYKIMSSFEEFRITCCDKNITIGTPTKTGSGTVTFTSGGDDYEAGDEVETCYGETTITATVTPSNGYQCTALTFSRADGEDVVIDVDPATAVPFRAATDFEITVEQNANTTLNTTVTFVALQDHYIDNMHYNATQNKSGNYGTAPTLTDETKGEQCTGLHYKFIGWIPESDMNMTTGVPTTTANMVVGGATGKYATGTNYYAIWAEEVTP